MGIIGQEAPLELLLRFTSRGLYLLPRLVPLYSQRTQSEAVSSSVCIEPARGRTTARALEDRAREW